MRPPVPPGAVSASAVICSAGLAVGVALGRPVTAWADWRVIEAWANREPAPDADAAAIMIEDRGGRMALLVPVRPAGDRPRMQRRIASTRVRRESPAQRIDARRKVAERSPDSRD